LEVVFLKTVTVLITVRNTSNIIKKCIDSILNLDYPKNRYKIFVVDAFSTDGTYEIIKGYGRKIILKQLKSNAPKAYNYAIKKINTELVAFTNADCVVKKNWLKEITNLFEDKEVLAVAGFTSNPPKPETKLQEIIGRELEYRYNHFPKKIVRAPDMNLCVRTNILKKFKFDESLDVSYDADFGYKVSEIGSIIYNPKAVVYHYHRATLKAYFKQQYKYANFVPMTYLKKHKTKIIGDNVSKSLMPIQISLLYLSIISILVGLIKESFNLFYFFLFILVLTYIYSTLKLFKKISDIPWFLFIFSFRNIAWNLGLIKGIFKILK